jgi:hypothetical protein
MRKEFIRIDDVTVNNNELLVKLSFSDRVKEYFKGDHLRITYDQNIENVSKSVLSIPAFAAVVTIAWGSGADVYLETIDSCFLESLKSVEQVFREWFPRFSFSTEIHADHIVAPDGPAGKRYALLFSGGLDSLTSYLRHREEKPTLITVHGGDIPLTEQRYWNLVKTKLQNFANQESLTIHFITTNERELINDNLAAKNFLGKAGGSWYGDVTHGLCLATAGAPLLTPEYGTLLVASSEFKQPKNPRALGSQGSLLFHFADVSIGNTRIVYDSSELTRMEKVKQILKPESHYASNLIVCSSTERFYAPSPQFLNCCVCEKCLRTIAELALQNIDPATCNFSLRKTEDALNLIKTRFRFGAMASDWSVLENWKDIQDITEENTGSGIKGAREFSRWFKTLNLNRITRTPITVLNDRLPILYCYSSISTRHQGIRHIIGFLYWTLRTKHN